MKVKSEPFIKANERIENLDAEFKAMATSKIIKLTDGADLYSAIEQSKDPQGIFEQLSLSQIDAYKSYKEKVQRIIGDKLRQQQQATANKKDCYIRFRVCDLERSERVIMSQPKIQKSGLLHVKAAFAEDLEPGSTIELENVQVRMFQNRDLMLAQGNSTKINKLKNKDVVKYSLYEWLS